MPHAESLLSRPILFNASLYAISALIYSATLFVLDTLHPGKYIFDPDGPWRNRFAYLAICSWPILLFGALILIAVRIGARSRRRRSKKARAARAARAERAKRAKQAKQAKQAKPAERTERDERDERDERGQRDERDQRAGRHAAKHADRTAEPPATSTPGGASRDARYAAPPKPPSTSPPPATPHIGAKKGSKSRRGRRGRRRRLKIPPGFVSVTRSQRVFAAFGFLWVAVGLACTASAAMIVLLGQRDRYRSNAAALGIDNQEWKAWVIPLFTGGLPALVYSIMVITSIAKIYTVMTARERIVNTPLPSEKNDDDDDDDDLGDDEFMGSGSEDGPRFDVEVIFEQPEGYASDTGAIGMMPQGGIQGIDSGGGGQQVYGRDVGEGDHWFAYEPEKETVERMMRQLRDLGFKNRHQNIAALQASSFDLEVASEKLANAQV